MGSPSIPSPVTPPEPPPIPEEPAEYNAEDVDSSSKKRVSKTNLRVRTDGAGAGTNVPGS